MQDVSNKYGSGGSRPPRGNTCRIHHRGVGVTELHIVNPKKKYLSLKFNVQKNTWHQNFLPKKLQDLNTSILIYATKQNLRPKKYVTDLLTQKNYRGC